MPSGPKIPKWAQNNHAGPVGREWSATMPPRSRGASPESSSEESDHSLSSNASYQSNRSTASKKKVTHMASNPRAAPTSKPQPRRKGTSTPRSDAPSCSADIVGGDNEEFKIELLLEYPGLQATALRGDLDCLSLTPTELGTVAQQLLAEMFEVGASLPRANLRALTTSFMATWCEFGGGHKLGLCRRKNAPAPFHRFAHAVDALAMLAKLLHPKLCGGQRYVEAAECWGLALAVLGHCAGHEGVDNGYHAAVGTALSDMYRDAQPVEAHAAAATLGVVRQHGALASCGLVAGRRAREVLILCVMSSGWGSHPSIADAYDELSRRTAGVYGSQQRATLPSKDDRTTFCAMLLHTAVVTYPARRWALASKWAAALAAELLAQGDALGRLGLAVPPHMERRRASSRAPQLAIHHLDNFVLPSLQLLGSLMPQVSDFTKTAVANRALFEKAAAAAEAGGPATVATGGSAMDGSPEAVSVARFQAVVMPEDELSSTAKKEKQQDEDGDNGDGGVGAAAAVAAAPDDGACGKSACVAGLAVGRLELNFFIQGGAWQFLSFAMTVLALFLDQWRDAALPVSADLVVNVLLFASFLFFNLEMGLMSLGQPGYFLSFFFWLDFAGTVSLILDIPFLFVFLHLDTASEDVGLVGGAKAARGARAARATKMARLVRLIRLVRFVRLLKFVARLGRKQGNGDDEKGHGADVLASKPSRIGEILAEQMSQRVVILVLLVLFIAPLLNAERELSYPVTMAMTCLEYLDEESLESFVATELSQRAYMQTSNFDALLYLEVNGVVVVAQDDATMAQIRQYPTDNEVYFANSASQVGCAPGDGAGCTVAMFDDRRFHAEEGLMGIYLIVFMVFLLSFGSWLFVGISRRLVVAPIERMYKVIDIVSISLNTLKKAEAVEEGVDEDDALFETSFLEEAVRKMADLLNMGYGAAGAEIIQRNLGLSGGSTIETFSAGRNVDAVFAFCDIRKFTNTTEVLQENVLRFVNLVGHVVHSNTMHYKGSPNKNIGDAFLLVWKTNTRGGKALRVDMPQTTDDLFPGFSSTKDAAEGATIADGALKAMVQTAYDLHHVNSAPTWELHRQLVALNILPPEPAQGDEEHALSPADCKTIEDLIVTLVAAGREIEMGYGLHFGWAIEGAIGSSMKIDASYLSPHVNTAARLEAATKQFGVPILMSGDFVSRLCESNAKLCRRIDSVILVGKAEPTALFTWDFWTGADLSQNHVLSPLAQLSQVSAAGDACTAFEYCAKFEEAEQAYEAGDWTAATSRLFECQQLLKDDTPARSLINVMSRFNFVAPADWTGSRQLTDK